MKQSTRIDIALSELHHAYRIIYLQSWDRNIIYKAFNESAVLRAWLTPLKLKTGFNDYVNAALIQEYDEYQNNMKETVQCIYQFDAQLKDDKAFSELLHTFLTRQNYAGKFLLLSGSERKIPVGFEDDVAVIRIPYIEEDELEDIILGYRETIELKPLAMLKRELCGNTEIQIRQIMNLIYDYGYLDSFNGENERECKRYIREVREKIINSDGTLTIRHYDDDQDVADIKMDEYTAWIRKRKIISLNPVEARKRGTSPLKGVIMIGLPGTGKTQAAKLTAHELKLPYVDFRLDELQNSSYGGSEERLRKYRDQINALPGGAVVVFDEVEKALGSSDGTRHEVTNNLLGIFLKWMSDSTNVFFYMTCNTADKLPTELLRPGRLNARFLTFMPSQKELEDIFVSQLRKKNESTEYSLLEPNFNYKNPFNRMMDELLRDATGKDSAKPDPFMTGADLAQLIEDTNITLWERGAKMPYREEDYTEVLTECAKNSNLTGETSFTTILKVWLYAKRNGIPYISGKGIISDDRDFDLSTCRFGKGVNAYSDAAEQDRSSYDRWFEFRFKQKMNIAFSSRKR